MAKRNLQLPAITIESPARRALSILLLAGTLMMNGCGSKKLFSAQFENQKVDDALIPKADVGLFREGPFGGVSVVPAPGIGNAGNWVQIANPSAASWGELDGFFDQQGDGHYLVTMRLFIPNGTSAIIDFDGGGVGDNDFLGVEFPAIGGVLPIPGSTGGGICCFPRDQVFSVAVDLTIGPSSKATLTLLGAAHGSFDVAISPNLNFFARAFGSVHLKTFSGNFFVNDISVIYNP